MQSVCCIVSASQSAVELQASVNCALCELWVMYIWH